MQSWSRMHSDRGVSPVIGVILMVAITVVLAGVVYYMVGQMGEDPASMRVGRIASWERVNMTEGEFTFTSFSPDTRPMDLAIIIRDKGSSGPLLQYDEATSSYITNANHTVKYTDQGGDAYIQKGDYLTITNLEYQKTYEIIIIDKDNNNVIAEMEFVFR